MDKYNKKINLEELEPRICKNCETLFKGNFCPACGQSIKEFEKPFGFMIIDFVGNLFAFDTRLWATLISILFKPGSMAKEYISGKRAKYMPPFRFYIFVSFIFFLLLSFKSNKELESKTITNLNDSLKFEQLKDSIRNVVDSALSVEADSIYNMLDSGNKVFNKTKKVNRTFNATFFNKNIDREFLKEHPEIFLDKFFKYLSWLLFILMPIYGFLFWLLYKKSYPYFISHLIFSVNQHAFFFIIFILMLVIGLCFPHWGSNFANYLLMLIPIYIILGTINLYKCNFIKSIFKLLFIWFAYLILIAFGAVIITLFAII